MVCTRGRPGPPPWFLRKSRQPLTRGPRPTTGAGGKRRLPRGSEQEVLLLASLALIATGLSTGPSPVREAGSAVCSDRVVQLVVALAQADADFSLKQEELGLTGAAPLTGLGDKDEPASLTAPAHATPARPVPNGRTAPAAKPASAKNR